MRDKNRIKEVLKELETLWEKYPDQRLGQILENYVFPNIVVKQCLPNGKMNECSTRVAWMFFQEDDVTLDKLRKLNNINNNLKCENRHCNQNCEGTCKYTNDPKWVKSCLTREI